MLGGRIIRLDCDVYEALEARREELQRRRRRDVSRSDVVRALLEAAPPATAAKKH
jgi:DNA replication initiation complex subunit (GINS family)